MTEPAPPYTRDDAVAALDLVYGVEQWDSDHYDMAQHLLDDGPDAIAIDPVKRQEIREALELVSTPWERTPPPKRKRPSRAVARQRAILRALDTLRKHAPHLLAETPREGRQ